MEDVFYYLLKVASATAVFFSLIVCCSGEARILYLTDFTCLRPFFSLS
jgi:hypothetical protein